jgi:hypothetical protein
VADHELIRAARATLSGSADLRPFGSGVLNQGNSSTCWAHSLTTALYRRQNVLGLKPVLASPLYFAQTMYATYRAQQNPSGALPVLADSGAQLDDADKCAAVWGAVPFQSVQQGGGTDVPATTDDAGNPIPIPELTVANAEAGAPKAFAGEYDIPVDGNAPETIAACLDAKVSIWLGGPVSSALDNLGADDIEQPCSAADAEGGHAREVVGYRTVSGELQFLIQNSWSSAWCAGGYSWASAAVITGAWSLLPFQVST